MYLQNHNISIEYPTVIPYTEFEHFGIIRFQVMLRQTDRQTDIYPRRQSVGAWWATINPRDRTSLATIIKKQAKIPVGHRSNDEAGYESAGHVDCGDEIDEPRTLTYQIPLHITSRTLNPRLHQIHVYK